MMEMSWATNAAAQMSCRFNPKWTLPIPAINSIITELKASSPAVAWHPFFAPPICATAAKLR